MVAAARRAGEKRLGAVRGIETEVEKQKLEISWHLRVVEN
jgi:hypothetical protein